MQAYKLFEFLVLEYNLDFSEQKFYNCYGGNWTIETYSFFNKSGCFTIQILPQRGDLDFYYSHNFSTKREELCEKMVDVYSIEPDIWKKRSMIGPFKRPFFWYSSNNILNTLSEALKTHISKHNGFFGIKVLKKTQNSL